MTDDELFDLYMKKRLADEKIYWALENKPARINLEFQYKEIRYSKPQWTKTCSGNNCKEYCFGHIHIFGKNAKQYKKYFNNYYSFDKLIELIKDKDLIEVLNKINEMHKHTGYAKLNLIFFLS